MTALLVMLKVKKSFEAIQSSTFCIGHLI